MGGKTEARRRVSERLASATRKLEGSARILEELTGELDVEAARLVREANHALSAARIYLDCYVDSLKLAKGRPSRAARPLQAARPSLAAKGSE